MIKESGFNDSQGIKFLNFISFFFQKLDLNAFVYLKKKFSPDTSGVSLEVVKLLHLCMDCHEVCFK